MRLLLDTQIAIWAVSASDVVPARARELIASTATSVTVSTVSILEIAIKHANGRSSAPPFGGGDAIIFFEDAGFELLNVTPQHAAAVGDLPLLHRDPFDRLLVAQALTEPLRLVTADRLLPAYSDTIIRC